MSIYANSEIHFPKPSSKIVNTCRGLRKCQKR